MEETTTNPTYRLSFFFDYNCGGCLWSDNDAAYNKYDIGVLDADIFDLHGNIKEAARIKLPIDIKQQVMELDNLHAQSLDWNNPGGNSPWSEAQHENFHQQAKALYEQIVDFLGDDFEIIYNQK